MYHEDVKCGVSRASMKTNCLLTKPELGKIKRSTRTLPSSSHAYGIKSGINGEGARDVTMVWKEHAPNADAKPGPDFCAMNKRATMSGVTAAKDLRQFRAENPMTINRGFHKRPPSGSQLEEGRVFGMDSRYRSAEKIRNFGQEEPFMQHVIQGAFQYDWIREVKKKEQNEQRHKMKRTPPPTKASQGHARGAQAFSEMLENGHHNPKIFKIKKFTNIPSRIKECKNLSKL